MKESLDQKPPGIIPDGNTEYTNELLEKFLNKSPVEPSLRSYTTAIKTPQKSLENFYFFLTVAPFEFSSASLFNNPFRVFWKTCEI